MSNKLLQLVENSNLDEIKSKYLIDKFEEFQAVADEWRVQADSIIVENESHTAEMKKANEGRKVLSQVRKDIEIMRKQLKDSSLQEGRTIDQIAKFLTSLVTPIEESLTQKAKFKELREAERTQALKAKRMEELLPFQVAIDSNFIVSMDEPTWNTFLSGVKSDYEKKIQLEKAAEEDRILQAKLKAEEDEKIRQENARLRAEAEARSRQLEAEKAQIRKEADEQIRKIAREAEIAKAKAEAERVKLQTELDIKNNISIDNDNIDDKDKLQNLNNWFNSINYPNCSTELGKTSIERVKKAVQNINEFLETKINLF